MKQSDVVVIGGSAAGIPAAITCRRHYSEKKILVVRKENQVQIPCGIPYIYGTVNSPENNIIPDKVLSNNNIDLIINEVVAIDPKKKNLKTKDGEIIGYDKLILATGSKPSLPPVPGLDKENVFVIKKEIPHLNSLLEKVNHAKDIVILGGGFIGVEFADECKKNRDVNVTIIEFLPHCLMLAFEEEFCHDAERSLAEKGINLITGVKVEEALGDKKISGVKLSDGREIPADLLIVSVGVKPNVTLAENAGLEVQRGGIMVDTMMKTSDEHIFACGDCTTKRSFFTGNDLDLKLASIATLEARIAGANLYGSRRENPGVIGAWSTIVNGVALGGVGLSEKSARELGYEVVVGQTEAPNRHPGGMPGSVKIKVKLVFNKKTQELIGGQIRGGDSVGELTNVICACIQKKMTADDIATFQFGTHPALTASPIAYQLVNAAEIAIQNMRKNNQTKITAGGRVISK
jgi:NADPH-dependent 2,4-dienoyl-CoA reductase/sulfur reductase-like enzyme